MNRLSIAMLCIHSSPLGALGTKDTGGMSVVVRESARELGSLGHYVDIYTAAEDVTHEKVVSLQNNVRLIHLNPFPQVNIPKSEIFHHLPQYYKNLNAFVRDEGIVYDLLHSHYWLSGRLGLWAQTDWGVPHVLTYHTLGGLKNHLVPSEDEPDLRMEWEWRLSRKCHRVLVATAKEKQNLVKQCEICDSKVGVVPFGVDTGQFRVMKSHKVRDQLGLNTDERVILFVGRFVPVKGIERLMEAVSIMDNERVRLLLIGGDGPDAESSLHLKDLSFRLGIHNKVTFRGRVGHSELVLYYNAADLLTVPSYYESFSLVALESLACGTPVVATPVGVIDSVIKNGENGVIVENHTPEGLAESLSRVLQRIQRRNIFKHRVRASVLRYDWPTVTKAIWGEYVREPASCWGHHGWP